jgi:inner membrane protein
MASAFTHAVAALAIGTAFPKPQPPARFWLLGVAGATIPDLDVIGYALGVPYDSVFGHRGLTHSLAFAAVYAAVCLIAFRDTFGRERRWVWLYLCFATASHGVLDAMTAGGGGIAFFAPFVNERYHLPWRPILVSPLNPGRFFSARGFRILVNEIVWVWLPSIAFAIAMMARKRFVVRNRNLMPDG